MHKKYRGLVLADLHFGACDVDRLKMEIRKNLLNLLETRFYFDFIIIAGDFWDKKIYLNDRSTELGMWLLYKLSQFTKCIRIVYGTESHDSDQYHIFSIFESMKGMDFKVIYKACEEELLPDLNVLYLPEEYIKNKDEYYKEYFSQKKKYDYIFGHGVIAEVMTMVKHKKESDETRLKPAVFTSADFKKCCRGEVYFGHYHVHSTIQDSIHYIGSFTRWIHGEEEPKGYYEIECGLSDEREYTSEFHINYDAPIYKTYSFGYDDEIFNLNEDLDIHLKTLSRLIENENFEKVKFIFNIPEDYPNPEFFISTMRDNFKNSQNVTCEFVNGYITKKKNVDEMVLKEISDKYDYLLNKNLSMEDMLNMYIKDTNGKDIGGEKIGTYLNTDILKLIELELEKRKELKQE